MTGMVQPDKITEELKKEIVKFIDEMKTDGISRERVCTVLMVPSRRVRRWRENFAERGSFEDLRSGPAVPYNKLNESENREIDAMSGDAKYSELSHRELAIRAQDEKRVFASKSTFYRRLKALGRMAVRKARRGRKKKAAAPKIKETATAPNRVWSWDFTYVWTGVEWIYLICILDVYSRKLMSWLVTRVMTDDVAIELWEDTLHRYGLFDPNSRPVPLWSFSDHGSQMTSKDTKKFFKEAGIPMAYARYNVPEDNGIHESFHKTMKHDKNMEFYFWKVSSEDDLIAYMEDFDPYYNTKRNHSGIGDVTPEQMHNGTANDIKRKRREGWDKAIRKRQVNNKKQNLKKSKKEERAA
jgi:putative transposase